MERTIHSLTEEQKQEYKNAVFSMINNAMFGTCLSVPQGIDWDFLFSILNDHAILAVVFSVMGNHSIPSDIYEKWKNRMFQVLANNFRVQYAERALLDDLRKSSIDVAVIKGSAAAYYYPNPEYRSRGDIDIIVPPLQYDNAVEVLIKNDYKLSEKYHFFKHSNFSKNQISIELHRYFINNDDADEQSTLPVPINPCNNLIFDAIPNACMKKVGEYESSLLPDMENGLVLLQHIKQHIKKGLGLRQIIDWMMFVDKCLNDDAWNSKFCHIAQSNKAETLAKVVTRMCQLKMGLRTTDITWCFCNDELCNQFSDYIFLSGNFGRCWNFQEQKANGIALLKSPRKAYRVLQSRGERNWTLLEKHPHLRCFAWIYQAAMFIKLFFKNRLSYSETKEMIVEGEKRSKLFDAIGI